jgi:hypothetical protein
MHHRQQWCLHVTLHKREEKVAAQPWVITPFNIIVFSAAVAVTVSFAFF